MDRNVTWDRVGAVSGLLFAVLAIVSMVVTTAGEQPSAPTDLAGIVAIDYNTRTDELRFGAFLMTASVFFLLWFLPFLRHRLEEAAGERAWMPSVAYGAGLTLAGMLLVLASLGFAGSLVARFEGDWEVAKTVLVLGWDHMLVLAPAFAAMVASTQSSASAQEGCPTGWHGYRWCSSLRPSSCRRR